ncbi:MAG: TonB family protein [Planctomycetota bacterium]
MTRVPPASPWAASASETPEGERKVVAVTFTMKMTNFANTPAYTEPSEPEPVDQQLAPLPATGDPNAVATTDSPGSGNTDPGPDPVEPAPTPDATLEKILEQLAQAPAPINPPQRSLAPLTEPTERLDQPEARPLQLALTEPATDPLDVVQPDITDALQEQAQEQPPTEQTESAEPVEPVEPDEQAEPDPTPPAVAGGEPSDDDEDQQEKPSTVFDETSVDQPIAFDRMARPKPAAVSKRLGESGTVRILVEVDEQGRLIRKTVVDATEYPRLLKASLAALERSTFLPAERAGEPVHSTRIIEYRF